jgi:translation initiation factor 2B subunit (eIF-2B alpha/beta/delta family)
MCVCNLHDAKAVNIHQAGCHLVMHIGCRCGYVLWLILLCFMWEQVYVHATSPMFDYVPPELVSLFVTDTGGFTPSYVYRLLAEYYSREDYTLSKQSYDVVFR